jgi:hypothetical protein
MDDQNLPGKRQQVALAPATIDQWRRNREFEREGESESEQFKWPDDRPGRRRSLVGRDLRSRRSTWHAIGHPDQ